MVNKKKLDKISGIREGAHSGVDKVMDKAESVRDGGKEAIANLKEKGMEMKRNVDGYIQENPGKSVAIAAGVGAVAGALIAGAMIKRKD